MSTLLVVDDEPSILLAFRRAYRDTPVEVLTAETAGEGLEMAAQRRPDVIILDIHLPDMSGLEALEKLRALDARSPVIFITGKSTTDTAIEAMKLGAYEYLLKPLELTPLRQIIGRAIDLSRLRHVPAVFEEAGPPETAVDRIVGRCPAMQEVYKAIGRVAPQDMTVLILGESGTGKELVARAIYQHGPRSQAPFLTINCAAIPESLLESELFGHEKGAFTGADRQRIGKFEQADHGTIFLDEIGDMSTATQAKVLRLLQEQRFERVGGNETIQTQVRVLAATNKDLEELVETGRFRRDLYYRLKDFTIEVPPLRERAGDLPLLVEHFLKIHNLALGKSVRSLAPEAMALLARHDWPGNVRELQSAIKYALIHAAGEVLTPDCLPENLRREAAPARTLLAADGPSLDVAALVAGLLQAGEPDLYRKVTLAVDRVVLDVVLRHAKGNQVQASQLMGISRNTLRAKLRALDLAIEKQLLVEPDRPE
jgi:two-component system nitrogen regulation response regulator GlnG